MSNSVKLLIAGFQSQSEYGDRAVRQMDKSEKHYVSLLETAMCLSKHDDNSASSNTESK